MSVFCVSLKCEVCSVKCDCIGYYCITISVKKNKSCFVSTSHLLPLQHQQAPARKMKLATCLLNISEARNQETIRKIIKASQASIEAGGGPIRACVLKVFRDLEYNRSVITIR